MSFPRFAAALSFVAAVSCTTQSSRRVTLSEVIFGPAVVLAGATQEPISGQSVYVVAGTIAEIGPAGQIRQQHPNARFIDVSGTTILPGLTDAHGHLYGLGLSLDTVNLAGANSYDEVIARVKGRAARASQGEWILGRGWDQNLWPSKEFPTSGPLDAAVPDHLVWRRAAGSFATPMGIPLEYSSTPPRD